jgi:hypothetical protein
MPNARPLSRFAKATVALDVFLSVGALGGGVALMLGPRGEIIPLPVSALQGSPFETYFAPGLILFCVLGLAPLAAALFAWRRHPRAPIGTLSVGVALLIWMAVEIAIVGYNKPAASAVLRAPRSRNHRRGSGLASDARTSTA